MSTGLSPEDISTIVAAVQKQLEPQQHPQLWLFGSRARGNHKKHSDIDLLLSESGDISDEQSSEIRDALEESNLPYKVDFILDRDLYAKYRASFEKERVLLKKF